MIYRYFYLLSFLLFFGCGKDSTSSAPPTPTPTNYTIKASAVTGGTVDTSGGTYSKGTTISIRALPSEGYTFTGWSNGSTDNPISITVDNNISLIASFTKKRYPLTLNTNGEGAITKQVVFGDDSVTATDYVSGTRIQITAVPSESWSFLAWSGDVSSTSNPVEITINSSKIIAATFFKTTTSTTASKSVVLEADGPGGTYSLITSVLAPENSPIEPPDCSHKEFGDHIDEIYDADLKKNVFQFHIHKTPDNDRCINFDRQRNEIKTYDKSPENLLGRENETVIYSWKFKLPQGFQSSSKFTHIHQLKSVGGNFASMPMYTLTTRKSSPDRLELRYAEIDKQITLTQIELSPLINRWVIVTETILYGTKGSYKIELKDIETDKILLEYNNPNIINWREGGEFVRPKWGVYRSLLFPDDLRDEIVRFADFTITEN